MADGDFQREFRGESRSLKASLGDGDRHLLARCPSCARAAPCDASPWVAEGLGALPLSAFTARLRCVCGGRQAELEVRPGPYRRPEAPDLHVFR